MNLLKPIWENKKFFRADLDFVVDDLLAISSREFQERIWVRAEGPEINWFEECFLSLEPPMDWLRYQIRKKEIVLSRVQIKAILRVWVMFNRFCTQGGAPPEGSSWEDEQLFYINHPYFDKIRKQADFALSLLRVR